MTLRLLPVLAGALALSSLIAPGPARSAYPGANGKIAFDSARGGDREIYAMSPDGTAQANLSRSAGADLEPAWSPDGRSIAFTSLRDGNYELYVMRADGSSQRNLTASPFSDQSASWSPDGTKIAFASDRDGDWDLYVSDAASGTVLRKLADHPAGDFDPAWSPDGQTIAFASERDGNREIYVVPADGSGAATRLTASPAFDADPAWSPDGKQLAFASYRDGNYEVYAMRADGSAQRNLTRHPALDAEPAWSPDGGRIAFVSNRDGNREIYVMGVDGSGPADRTCLSGSDEDRPDWQRASTPLRDGTLCGTSNPVATYAPLVLLDPRESAYPDPVDAFLRAAELWWSHDGGCDEHPVAEVVSPSRLGNGPDPYSHFQNRAGECRHGERFYANQLTRPNDSKRGKLTRVNEGFYLDLFGDRRATFQPGDSAPLRLDPVYYEYEPRRYVVYWFFYPFNRWEGTYCALPSVCSSLRQDHEGDWEHVVVRLDAKNQATQVAYYAHGCAPAVRAWAELGPTRREGTHPVVYAALGSHGSYPDPGDKPQRGSCGGSDRVAELDTGARWETWRRVVNARAERWYGFGGAWGMAGVAGPFTGPLGPSQHLLPSAVPSEWR